MNGTNYHTNYYMVAVREDEYVIYITSSANGMDIVTVAHHTYSGGGIYNDEIIYDWSDGNLVEHYMDESSIDSIGQSALNLINAVKTYIKITDLLV